MITRRVFSGAEEFAAMLSEVSGDVVQYGKSLVPPEDRHWKEWSCTAAPLSCGAIMHFTSAGPIAGMGTTDADKVVLLMPWMHKVPHFYRGVEMSRHGAALYGPGAAHVGKCDTDHAFTVFLIHAERLRDYLHRVVGPEAGPVVGSFSPVNLPAALRDELESIVNEVVGMAGDADAPFSRESVRLGYEDRIMTVIAEMVSLGADRRLGEMPRHEMRTKLVNACWNLARQEQDRNLTMEDLCVETKASERVLRCAFQEMTGHSPALFLRNHRLHKARRMLLDEASSVKEAAYSCGFTEMGRFSGYYRKLFGENPSATLARRPSTAGALSR